MPAEVRLHADTGWVFPVADEPRVAGHDTVIDAAYRSMRSGRWEPVETRAAVAVR